VKEAVLASNAVIENVSLVEFHSILPDNLFVSETKRKSSDVAKRYERYLPVVNYVCSQVVFDIESIKEEFDSEQPGFLTRLVNDLVKQGWLVREEADAEEDSTKSTKKATKASELKLRWNQSRGEFVPNKWLDEKLFGAQVKASPEQGRPRERLLEHGVEKLSNAELVAVLVRNGLPGESAVMAGDKVAKQFNGKLDRLPDAGRGELKSISSAVGKIAYCQIMAGIELGRRVAAVSEREVVCKISSSEEAIAFCERRFARLVADGKQEEFHIVTLDTKNQVIDSHLITIGTLDASLVHPREVFRAAIKDAASSIILVHNHPSGDPTPSREDVQVTDRLTECGKTLGIDVLDHIVVGKGGSVSIRASD
jgi:DNA repair protein RadC